MYNTGISATTGDFEEIHKRRPKKEFQEVKFYLDGILNSANEIASNIVPFSFEVFEKRYNNNFSNTNLISYYDEAIENFKSNAQIASATSYTSSLTAITKYLNSANPQSVISINLHDITVKWLDNFERDYLKNGGAISSVGTHLRPLRAIYNKALLDNNISPEISPFGYGKFVIPSSTKVKKALDKEHLEKLINATPENYYQEKAKDFWFLSFYCTGMNISDIIRIKGKDLNFELSYLEFYRNKSFKSTKSNLRKVTVVLNDQALDIINKYKVETIEPNKYIFDIISDSDSATEIERKKGNFIRFINMHIKKLAKTVGITEDISVNWARHTFSSIALNVGTSAEFIKDALGHKDLKTTYNYLNGFDTEEKRKTLSKIYKLND